MRQIREREGKCKEIKWIREAEEHGNDFSIGKQEEWVRLKQTALVANSQFVVVVVVVALQWLWLLCRTWKPIDQTYARQEQLAN